MAGGRGGSWSPKEAPRRIRATEETATAIQGRYSDELLAVFIAREEGPFQQFFRRSLGWGPEDWMTLGPGERRMYRLRVLYARQRSKGAFTEEENTRLHPGGLGFDQPGHYRVKVAYPFWLKGADAPEMIDSNAVAIRVRKPVGIDARVWRRIQDEETLQFIQTGGVPTGREEVVSKVADVLADFPNSGYHRALRHALRSFYGNRSRLPDGEWQRIRTLLSITPEIDRFFPSDGRLDTRILNNPGGATIDQILAVLSERTGVGLEATPTVGRQSFKGPLFVSDLRSLMQDIARDHNARWVQRDDRYVLWDREEYIQDAMRSQ